MLFVCTYDWLNRRLKDEWSKRTLLSTSHTHLISNNNNNKALIKEGSLFPDLSLTHTLSSIHLVRYAFYIFYCYVLSIPNRIFNLLDFKSSNIFSGRYFLRLVSFLMLMIVVVVAHFILWSQWSKVINWKICNTNALTTTKTNTKLMYLKQPRKNNHDRATFLTQLNFLFYFQYFFRTFIRSFFLFAFNRGILFFYFIFFFFLKWFMTLFLEFICIKLEIAMDACWFVRRFMKYIEPNWLHNLWVACCKIECFKVISNGFFFFENFVC